jgi:hypothetical protein
MNTNLVRFAAIALLLCLNFACQKKLTDESGVDLLSASGTTLSSGSLTECGTPQTLRMGDHEQTYGEVSVWNDATTVYIKVTALPGGLLQRASGLIGSLAHLQSVLGDDVDETQGPTPPDFIQTFSPEVSTYTFSLPVAQVFANNGCVYVNVHAVVARKDESGNTASIKYIWVRGYTLITSYQFSKSFEYCRTNCPPPPPDCKPGRTQTPGGWGAEPSGNNAGAYLHANFDAAFGDFMTVGCYPGNYYVKLTSAQAITNLLPTGGTAGALTDNYSDPASIKNVLVGHVVALKLSVGFDAHDANYSPSGTSLGAMKIASGTFAGKTVSEFLAIAEKVLGGCNQSYTPQQVLETATLINENYIDGLIDNGFLVCPR